MIKIKEYIDTNYDIYGNLTFKHINGICVVNCEGNVIVKNRKIEKLTDGFVWGEIKGNFNCSHCSNLISLDGSPKKVVGSFSCSWCDKLTSLQGSPEKVGRNFYSFNCPNLKP